ncbi:ATPase involved in chromosome partitioning [Desulfocapsa sulfexigens DSM 10523]|uniref:ATPase involved in chromosome partitioning n=1 Tax=Desulfocapsa sulfexigens (strain DSM 10523 / SB164P1) TaxID=1167006 RepID=M1NDA9_DESSD|nr:ParA family protein [Desulfocapsa sulfexigens]AGF77749.1 ATPase involved in chromosome partitioning [Desulfocapsa sulfexigens DSM 10523]
MIITLTNQKGGCGKSTATMNLALGTAALNYKTALIDTDEQKSCLETLGDHSKSNLTLYEAREDVEDLVAEIKSKFHFIFIDTPPHSHHIMYRAMAVSDFIIIPLQASPLDIRSAKRTIDACERVQKEVGHDIPCYFLLNRVNPRTKLSKEIGTYIRELYSVPLLQSRLHNRVAYAQSLMHGKSVIEHSRSSDASLEVTKLLKEVHRIFQEKS